MSYADNTSTQWVKGHGWRAALAAASLALVVCATVSAAEPPVTGEYQSIFKGYRSFDAQASAVAWRQANDAIGIGSADDTHGQHGMNEMHGRMETAPTAANESQPTTPGNHQEHRR
jgi:hypothetical protein